jgi:hypothetical protein
VIVRSTGALALTACLLLFGGACTAHEPDPPKAAEFITSGVCPGEEDLVADESLRDEGRLEGDVDGDGSHDTIFLVRTRGEPNCSVFLVVETDGGTLSAPAPPNEGSAALGLPSLTGFAQIDGEPGLEVYLTVLAGASTEFLSVFSAATGGLERLDREGGEAGGLFPSGGSVAHLEASDCREEGGVVVSLARQQDGGWAIVSNYYVSNGNSFVPADPSQGITTDPVGRLRSWSEFRFTPFGSCPTSPE